MAGNSDRGIMVSSLNRVSEADDGGPHWCSVARGREGFVGALLRDSTQNFQLRLCCPAKSSPSCQLFWPAEPRCHPNAAKIMGNQLAKKRELHRAPACSG